METTQTQTKFVEWLNAEDMHKASQEWLSQLYFAKDEHLFFEDLIKSSILQLFKPERFSENKEVIDTINRSQKQNNTLIKTVKTHENELQIMVDGINQLNEEEAYKKEHRRLIVVISDFLREYRALKVQLFDIIKDIRKTEKQLRLLDKE